MIKKTILATFVFASMFLCGCKSEKIQVIDNQSSTTNNVSFKAFNDESYVWENWTFTTNRVDK